MALLITDPVVLKMTTDGDLDMSAGPQIVGGVDAVVVGVNVRLRLFRGEWFLDRDAGRPWLANDVVTEAQALLGQTFSEPRWRREVLTAILATPGVKGVTTLTITFDRVTRVVSIAWRANTVFGDTGLIATEF